MTFIQKFASQRTFLAGLGRRFHKNINRNSPRTPVIEALEPRALFSMVPSGIAAVDLGDVTATGSQTHVVSATSNSGQYVVAWMGEQAATEGLFYNVYKSDGTLLTSGGSTTGFIATTTSAANIDITVNDNNLGAIAWLSDNVIHAQRINLQLGTLSGSEAQKSAAAGTDISNFNIALDSAGVLGVLWQQSDTYSVTPAASATAQDVTADSLYLAVNLSGNTWSSDKTVVDTSLNVSVGQFASISDSDLVAAGASTFIAAWQQSTNTFTYDSLYGSYTPQTTTLDTYVQKFTNITSSAAVNVSHKVASNDIQLASLKLTRDDNGTLAIAQNVTYELKDGAGSSSTLAYDVLTVRTYDINLKALSAETEIVRSDVNSEVVDYALGFDTTHNLVTLWQFYNSGTDTSAEWSQVYTAKAAKVGTVAALNVDQGSYASADQFTLLASDTGFKLTYLAYDYDANTSTLTGSVMAQSFGDKISDISVSLGATTLKPNFKTGSTNTGNLPIIITNVGNAATTGAATITIAMVNQSDHSSVTIKTLYNQTLGLAAGKSKTITLSNFKIEPASYTADGDYQLVVTVTPNVSAANYNTTNDSAVLNMTVSPTDAITDDLAVASVAAKFTQPVLVPGDKGTITVVIRNTGNTDLVNQPVTVNVSASADGLYNSALALATKTLTLSLKAGASTTLTFPVTLTSALAQGTYRFAAQVLTPGTFNDINAANDIGATTAASNLVWSFGNVAGRTGATSFVWTASDGAKVTYSLTGPGYGVLQQNADALKDGNSQVLDLSYVETTGTSKLSIGVVGGSGVSTLGDITGYTELGSLTGAKTNLLGSANLKTIGALTLNNMTAGASQEIDIHSTSTKTVAITLANAANLIVKSDMAISAFTALDWSGADASLETSTLKSLSIKGSTVLSLAGNCTADVILSGQDAKGLSLGTISVAGLLQNAAIRTVGDITSVTAGAASNVSILAGIADTVEDVRTASPTKLLPTADDDFTDAYGKIGAVTFKGLLGKVVTASTDFYIAAASVGTLNLGRVAAGTSDAYGLAALSAATTPVKIAPYTKVSLTYTDSGLTKSATFTPTTANLAATLTTLSTLLKFNVDTISRPLTSSSSGYNGVDNFILELSSAGVTVTNPSAGLILTSVTPIYSGASLTATDCTVYNNTHLFPLITVQ